MKTSLSPRWLTAMLMLALLVSLALASCLPGDLPEPSAAGSTAHEPVASPPGVAGGTPAMSSTNRPNPRPTPVLYCGDTVVPLAELDTYRCPEGFRVEAPSCPSAYSERVYPFARAPLLTFWNDTAEPLVIRRIDVAGFPAVTVAPACSATAENGGAFFGGSAAPRSPRGRGSWWACSIRRGSGEAAFCLCRRT